MWHSRYKRRSLTAAHHLASFRDHFHIKSHYPGFVVFRISFGRDHLSKVNRISDSEWLNKFPPITQCATVCSREKSESRPEAIGKNDWQEKRCQAATKTRLPAEDNVGVKRVVVPR